MVVNSYNITNCKQLTLGLAEVSIALFCLLNDDLAYHQSWNPWMQGRAWFRDSRFSKSPWRAVASFPGSPRAKRRKAERGLGTRLRALLAGNALVNFDLKHIINYTSWQADRASLVPSRNTRPQTKFFARALRPFYFRVSYIFQTSCSSNKAAEEPEM